MDRIYFLGGATAAGIVAVAGTDHAMIWAPFLLAMEVAACVLFRKQFQGEVKPVPVLAKARRPIRRAAPGPRWR